MFSFHSYGLFIGLAIAVAFLVIKEVNKKYLLVSTKLLNRFSEEQIFLWLVVAGLIGARLYHVIDYWQYYLKDPLRIFFLWQGGLAIYGAIGGGILGLIIFLKSKIKNSEFKAIFLSILDLISFGLPIGQAIGRLGNFFNQELYGLPTQLPWGIYIKPENRLLGHENLSRFHPLFAYEAVWNLIIFIILLTVLKVKEKPKPGSFLFLYLGLYGFGRFWLEFLRISPWETYGINVAQGISLFLMMLSLFWFTRKLLR